MKIIQKSFAVILLLSTCVVMFYAGRIPLMEGYNPIFPNIDTRFADNYDEVLFRQINVGDDTCIVISKIGYPIEIYKNDDQRFQWNYSTDGKCKEHDFAWLLRAIVIDENGKVIKKYSSIIYD